MESRKQQEERQQLSPTDQKLIGLVGSGLREAQEDRIKALHETIDCYRETLKLIMEWNQELREANRGLTVQLNLLAKGGRNTAG